MFRVFVIIAGLLMALFLQTGNCPMCMVNACGSCHPEPVKEVAENSSCCSMPAPETNKQHHSNCQSDNLGTDYLKKQCLKQAEFLPLPQEISKPEVEGLEDSELLQEQQAIAIKDDGASWKTDQTSIPLPLYLPQDTIVLLI